jgi:glutathione S-transferase
MAIPDADIHPTATGHALKTVEAHQDPAAVVLYSGEQLVDHISNGMIPIGANLGWFCPFVQRVWLALEEKGISYRKSRSGRSFLEDTYRTIQFVEYKEENPYHKV